MNPSTYTTAGSATALLAQLIMWLSKWPIAAPSEAQATAAAGLVVLLVGSIHGIINARKAAQGAPNA